MRLKSHWKNLSRSPVGAVLATPPVQHSAPHPGPGRKGRRTSERGQGFMELAISLVFLLILLSFLIDLGYAFYTIMAMRDAAQEAASYGAICPFEEDGTSQNLDRIRLRLRSSATAPLDVNDIDEGQVEIIFINTAGHELNADEAPVLGGSVKVTLTVNHAIMVPFLGAVIGRYDYPLTVEVADTVIRSKWMDHCD